VSLRAREVAPTHPARALPRDDAEPLDADLRRLHVTVSRRLLDKLDRARHGLSHVLPGATTEQVLEAALDLLLERQARAKALVRRPRSVRAPEPAPADPRAIPAAVEREVRLRDGDRCAVPLDAGGVCGSTWQVELDHLTPVALGGQATVANLRCACRRHNRLAAEWALRDRAMPP
jgi:5-methylcytosine-specific restriction endonuclease McrA